jgi:hypothetical protein
MPRRPIAVTALLRIMLALVAIAWSAKGALAIPAFADQTGQPVLHVMWADLGRS